MVLSQLSETDDTGTDDADGADRRKVFAKPAPTFLR
jgi:hypothetical protein